ncbi:MAG TPA: histidine--tRNA ligase [Bacilli bacterium]|nr:histidine--tRNA ligase [Bacilli bacterium]
MISKQKGTYDLYGEEARKVLALRNIFENIMNNFNYSFIRTPVFESTELFKRTSGETSDVVSKEMYEFKDKKDRSLALRPEGTASVARCFIENKLYTDLPRKFWYFEPMYRYDRPQKGRYREHFQFGCEAYGSNDARVDAEIISIPYHLFETLGLEGVKVRINTLGDNESRENYKKALVDYLKPHIDSLCEDCKERFNKNPLRILDCKVDKDNEILKNIPKTIDYLNEESKTFFDEVLSYLDSLEICYEVDPKTIRGLDYYTHTVFEIEANIKDFGAQNVLCAGGRYNNLVENLDGPATPAVGFGLGSERLLLALEHENIDIALTKSVDVYVIPMTLDKTFSFSLVYLLRTLGLSVETDYLNRKLANNFKYAEKINAKYTVVIGEDEIEKEYFTVKNMKTREEEKVSKNEFLKYILEHLEQDDCSCSCDCDEDDCDKGCDSHDCSCF